MLSAAHPLVKCAFILFPAALTLATRWREATLGAMWRPSILWLLGFVMLARVSAADPLATLRPGHPRILLTNEQLAEAIALAKQDPLRARLHERIVALARAELGSKPIEHRLIGPRLLDQSRRALGRVLTCAMAYRLTGERQFAERATQEMLTAAAFQDWNPSHFLDVAELTLALGVGYDWLFDALSPSERLTLKNALLRHSLAYARDAYAKGGPKDKRLWFVTAHHNWNQVCNGGLLAGALALADEEPELARLIVTGAVASLPRAMAAYAPDGAYPEGPGYWGYGTSYNVIAIALLESALGTDGGLAQTEAFDRTAIYRLHIQGTSGQAFNHADGGAGIGAQAEYSWLANRYGLDAARTHSRALLTAALDAKRLPRNGDRLFALHAVWFPAPPAGGTVEPLDRHFRGPAELALFRSAWNDDRALFAGLKAGSNAVNHSHLDLGSFVLDADGVRWAEDLGPDDYNLPAYFGAKRWTYYRLNNFSHNTLTPGNTLQDPKAVAPVIAFSSTPVRASAVVDLTPAYPGSATNMRRGLAMLDRARVLVQDEITGAKAGTVLHWRMTTPAKVVLEDGQHAVLSQGGKTLRATILEPAAATFAVSPATPPTRAEKQNEGATVLSATVTIAGGSERIAVLLTPLGAAWPEEKLPACVPLGSWH
jgi:hypothetical protein